MTLEKDRVVAYSDFLTRALRHASRASVLEQIKGLSNVLFEALDMAKVSNLEESKVPYPTQLQKYMNNK